MKRGRDRAGQVWELDDTVYLVLRSRELDACTLHDVVVVLATDPFRHNWKPGVELSNWFEGFAEGQEWGEGHWLRRRLA